MIDAFAIRSDLYPQHLSRLSHGSVQFRVGRPCLLIKPKQGPDGFVTIGNPTKLEMNDGRMRRYFHSEAKYFVQARRGYIFLSSSIVKIESKVDSKER